ncbi:hypothetical protein [Rhizobium leguminosarum]|uniref:hypothetical protein n=1 Tax=Rhizobium leguminosarum TaxID=384 RepID=UPI001C94E3D3|nr:hypothetical protein [Rhizobium leguminosarum]MBY5821468.1 hypothetical protein [Rhizobium leguminosarum]
MNFHGNPLPSAAELAGMLRHYTLAEVTASLGADRKAITTKLRRYGMGLGKPQSHYVVNVVVAPLRKEKKFHPDRVTRTTFAGAEVTMPRLTFLDGEPVA